MVEGEFRCAISGRSIGPILMQNVLRQSGRIAYNDLGAEEVDSEKIAVIDGIRINLKDIETNLVFFEVDPELGDASQWSAALKKRGVRISVSGAYRLRACTHLDVSRDDVLQAADIIYLVNYIFKSGPAPPSP